MFLALALADVGGPDTVAPDRSWDLTHLHLDLKVDPAKGSVEGSVTLSLRPIGAGSRELILDQEALQIRGVRAQGKELPFTVGDGTLQIRELPAEPVELVVSYAAHPRNGMHFRGSGPDEWTEAWTQGEGEDNRYWLPLWDHPNDRFTTSGRYQAPAGYKVLSNGVGQEAGGVWEYRMEQDLVSYLVMLAVGPYQVVEGEWRGRPVQRWMGPTAAPHGVGSLPQMLDFFSEKTGLTYPYPVYREVYVQRFLYTGMENTTATVMAERVNIEPRDADLFSWSESVVAHELAHQWYGDALTCNTWNELWLNEGFATFFAAEWMRTISEEDFWVGVAGRFDASHTSGPLAGRWWSRPEGDTPPNDNVYNKGSSLLQSLRVLLGEETFWAGIHLYTTRHAHQLVETDDLRSAMEEVSGRHLGWFFDAWAHLEGAPTLDVSPSWSNGELKVALHRTGLEVPLPVDLDIATPTGVQRRRVWVDQERVVLTLPLEAPPTYVAVDPDGGLLAKIENSQSIPMWIAQAREGSPYARLRAIRRLTDEPDAQSTLLELAAAGTPRAWRLEAIRALSGKCPPELVMDDDRRVAIAAAEALGHGKDPAPLAKAWKAWTDPSVRAAALRAWARTDRESARGAALGLLRAKAPDPILGQAAVDVLADKGAPGDLATLERWIVPTTEAGMLHGAMWAAARITTRMEAGPTRRSARGGVARRVEALLDDPFLRTRQNAIRVLAELKDPASIDALRALKRVETVGSVRASIDEAIGRIQAGDEESPPLEDSETQSRLAAIERRQEELEEQMEGLSTRH